LVVLGLYAYIERNLKIGGVLEPRQLEVGA